MSFDYISHGPPVSNLLPGGGNAASCLDITNGLVYFRDYSAADGETGWLATGSSVAAPVGSIQFNLNGVLGGSSNLTWDNVGNNLTVTGGKIVSPVVYGNIAPGSAGIVAGNTGNTNGQVNLTAGSGHTGSVQFYNGSGTRVGYIGFDGGTTDLAVTLTNSGNLYVTGGGITQDNTTAATSGVSQPSPLYTLRGRYWDGAASQVDSWTIQNVVSSGTNGATTLTWVHTGTSGPAAMTLPAGCTLNVSNNIIANGFVSGLVPNGAIAQWRTANDARWQQAHISELITLSTSGTTTDSVANLLPANSIIEAVVARVTTTITTATDWKLGDATTPGRFTAADSIMTAGETQIGLVQVDQTGAAGPKQIAAAKLRITTTGTPGAGVIRVTVFYRTFIAPSS